MIKILHIMVTKNSVLTPATEHEIQIQASNPDRVLQDNNTYKNRKASC